MKGLNYFTLPADRFRRSLCIGNHHERSLNRKGVFFAKFYEKLDQVMFLCDALKVPDLQALEKLLSEKALLLDAEQ